MVKWECGLDVKNCEIKFLTSRNQRTMLAKSMKPIYGYEKLPEVVSAIGAPHTFFSYNK